MGGGHRDKTGIGFLADQRVQAGKVDVIVQQHQIARPNIGAQASRRIGHDQMVRPQRLKEVQRWAHGG